MALPKSKQNGGSRASALENRHVLVRHNRPSCRCNQSSGRKRAKLQSCLGRILRKGSLAFSPSLSKLFLLALDTGIGRRGGSATARPSPPKQAAVIRKAQRALLKTLLTGAPIITADQIRAKVKLPNGVDPKCFGCVPRPLAQDGIIMSVGFVNSVRDVAHARTLRIWRLRDPVAAEKWLKSHPEIEPTPPGGAGRVRSEA